MITPSKIIKGSCEITTGAFIPVSKPPVYQGESGTVKVELSLLENGSPYTIPTRSEAYFYLNYDARKRRTTSMPMSINYNTVYGVLAFDHTLLSGAPDIVVVVFDEAMNTQVACKIPVRIIESMADLAVYTSPPPPGITIYVGRSPYVGENGNWLEWNEETQTYVDSGMPARGETGTIEIIGTQGVGPDEQARFVETAESTENDRKYEAHIPAGKQGEAATFEIVKTLTGDEDSLATITEAEDSTPQNRKYNVTIPVGKSGTGLTIRGLYPSLEDLLSAHPMGNVGDAYAIGTDADNTIYLWHEDAEEWVNIGKLKGLDGKNGIDGKDGNVIFASFEIDPIDGNLYVIYPDGYDGPTFELNNNTRQLEVIINA